VEEFGSYTTDQLYNYLGLSNQELPYFNSRIDPTGVFDPWTNEGNKFYANEQNTCPLIPKWHQLVGIAKMVTLSFDAKPTLLMDEVGLGKTLQVAGFIAVITYFREFYKQYKCFPGHFSKQMLCEERI
jgi:hypothetical protein